MPNCTLCCKVVVWCIFHCLFIHGAYLARQNAVWKVCEFLNFLPGCPSDHWDEDYYLDPVSGSLRERSFSDYPVCGPRLRIPCQQDDLHRPHDSDSVYYHAVEYDYPFPR